LPPSAQNCVFPSATKKQDTEEISPAYKGGIDKIKKESYNIELCDRYTPPNTIRRALIKDKRRAQLAACTAPVKMHEKFQP